MYYKSNRANFKIPCLPCTERNALGGGGVGIYVSNINGVKQRFLSKLTLTKIKCIILYEFLISQGTVQTFEIKRCLLSLVKTFMIPHKAHSCTAGIAHWRRGTKDLNDLTEKREKGYNFNIIVYKLQRCSNQCFTGDCKNQFLICYKIHKKLCMSNWLKTGAFFMS